MEHAALRPQSRAAAVGLGVLAAATLLAPLSCGARPALTGSARGLDVFVTLIDAAAAGRIGAFGGERPTTPFIDQLAAAGTRFARTSSAAPYTLASVASLFTGEHVDVHQVIHPGDVLPAVLEPLAGRFKDAGYRTFGASANAHIHARYGFDRGFETFEWFDPMVGAVPHHVVPDTMLASIERQLASDDPRPAFVYAHLMPPHAPYDPPPAFRRLFAPDLADGRAGSIENLTPLSHGARVVPPAEARAILDLYDGSLRYVDSVLARFGALLEREQRLERTLWIVLSDHGEAFGEHGLWQHSRLVVETMLHVPLVLRAPRGFAGGSLEGRIIDAPVSLVDLAPTLVELCGLEGRRAQSGVSLVPLLSGARLDDRPPIVARTAGPGPYTSVRRGDLKAIYHAGNRRWQLFDLGADPLEQSDLAASRPADLAPLVTELETWWQRWRPYSVGVRERVQLGAEERARLGAIGYFVAPTDVESEGDAKGDAKASGDAPMPARGE